MLPILCTLLFLFSLPWRTNSQTTPRHHFTDQWNNTETKNQPPSLKNSHDSQSLRETTTSNNGEKTALMVKRNQQNHDFPAINAVSQTVLTNLRDATLSEEPTSVGPQTSTESTQQNMPTAPAEKDVTSPQTFSTSKSTVAGLTSENLHPQQPTETNQKTSAGRMQKTTRHSPPLTRVSTKSTLSSGPNQQTNHGPVVATLIITTLFIMFIVIIIILVKKKKIQKRQLESPDWAGPSPFLDGHDPVNPPNVDGQISTNKHSRNHLSKRLSFQNSMREDVIMGDILQGNTFGRENLDSFALRFNEASQADTAGTEAPESQIQSQKSVQTQPASSDTADMYP